jgi:hypothetical protein
MMSQRNWIAHEAERVYQVDVADNRRAHNTGQAGRHPTADHPLDFYETPACAVRALLRAERLPPHPTWEPCAGNGAIARVLREFGFPVVASDIVQRDFPLDFCANFFEAEAPPGCESIITNPPYRDAAQMVTRALQLVPRVYFLLRYAFYESKRRSPILDAGTLPRIHVFSDRLPMMHRHGWTGPKASSQIAFAWFVWDARHNSGETIIDRISWRDEQPDLFSGRS